jgi:hypothetical protein
MNVGRVLGRLAARAAAVGLAVGYVGLAVAADTPVMVAPAAPVVVGEVCPTCTGGEAGGAPCGKAGCRTCGGLLGHVLGHHRAGCSPKKPVVGELRPGACFGYFQTQWHRWEDVCPIPYQGVGLNDSPSRLPTAGLGAAPAPGAGPQPKSSTPPPAPKSDGPAPKSDGPTPKLNPVPGGGTPGLPVPPPNKFGK